MYTVPNSQCNLSSEYWMVIGSFLGLWLPEQVVCNSKQKTVNSDVMKPAAIHRMDTKFAKVSIQGCACGKGKEM